ISTSKIVSLGKSALIGAPTRIERKRPIQRSTIPSETSFDDLAGSISVGRIRAICRSYGVVLTLRKIHWPRQEKQEKPIAARKNKKNRLSANGLTLTKIILLYSFWSNDRATRSTVAQP